MTGYMRDNKLARAITIGLYWPAARFGELEVAAAWETLLIEQFLGRNALAN